MSQSDSWLVLKQLEHDPDYGPLLLPYATALRELLPASLRPHLSDPVIHIMVSSPRRVTPYHNDHEVAVLMQVRGRKHISIFDQTDRAVLSEQEIERLYIGDIDAARYRDGVQDKASVFELVPGVGVNIPSLAPHWVQNGDEVSVSVNINFRVADYIRADLYRANYHLRRIGLNPRPPGHSKLRDAMKKTLYRTYKRIARPRA
jgi:Cupin-like domain